MSIFPLIIFGLPIMNIVWWWWADVRLRRLPHARYTRWLLLAFAGGNLAIYAWVLLARTGGLTSAVPTAVLGVCYIWHLVVLPATLLLVAASGIIRLLVAGVTRLARWFKPSPAPAVAAEPAGVCPALPKVAPASVLTRRQVLATAAIALPPLVAATAQVRALSQLDTFRIRQLELELAALPAALDGLTIAHISDVHVGRFTHGQILDDVVTRTNALRPGLILVTGDLIDHALADLPEGLDTLRRLTPAAGLFMCEGNHDLFEGREEFERRVRAAGVPLLLNESAELTIRGQSVQILGLRWGRSGPGRGGWLDEQMDHVLPLLRPGAFPILLTHHPHAFDRAAEANIPLTLSGHTHGGQLMLTDSIGAGPVLFKYWSGLYRRASSALVVSNGVGNWFPLRVNAPAEILHLTLRAARGETRAWG